MGKNVRTEIYTAASAAARKAARADRSVPDPTPEEGEAAIRENEVASSNAAEDVEG